MDGLEIWFWHGLKALALFGIALVVARLVSVGLAASLGPRMGRAHSLLLARFLGGAIWALALLLVMHEFGVQLSVVLGAAGIATVALGFAAQTSASNLISGIFLLGDRAFSVGDVIKVDATQGEVVAVDQLSIKLRTPDNLMVRIPNETLIKASIVNLTRWPIRRLDIPLLISMEADLDQARELLLAVAAGNPLCLVEPPPMVMFLELNEAGVRFQFSTWVERKNLADVGVQLISAIKREFAAAGIEFGASRRVLLADRRPGGPVGDTTMSEVT